MSLVGVVDSSSAEVRVVVTIKLDLFMQRLEIKGSRRFRDHKLWRNH